MLKVICPRIALHITILVTICVLNLIFKFFFLLQKNSKSFLPKNQRTGIRLREANLHLTYFTIFIK